MNDSRLPLCDPIFRRISRLVDAMGLRAYVVGGYVRDFYLGRPCTDIDVVVVGSGIAVAEALAAELHTRVSVFKTFGTAMLIALAVQVVEQAVALVSSLPELLAALPETMASLERRLEGFCAACPDGVRQTAEHMLDSLPRRAAELAGQVSSAVLQGAGRAMAALPRVLLACGTTVLAVFFTLSAYPAVRGFFRRQLGSRLERARGVKSSVFATLGKWLKAECILLAVTFCQLLAGLLLMRQEYALLLAALIALIDALPVFGTGTVLVPWAAVECLLGAVPRGIALLALFAVISVVRSVLEPKLMAAQAGLPPLASLCAMYVGFCAMGVAGMVLAPMALMLVKQLRDGGYIRLWR